MTNPPPPRRLVVLASGTGTTLEAVLAGASDTGFGARVVAVVADRADAPALDLARTAGVATAVVAPPDFADRDQWDAALARTVTSFSPDLVLMAGFMRLVGAPLLDAFDGRLVNTHPSLLPAFPGAHAVRDALAAGVKVTGCTVMLVDAGVDTGPVVAQEAVPVEDDDDEATLHERIKQVERVLVTRTVGRMARDGWTVTGRHVRLGPPQEET